MENAVGLGPARGDLEHWRYEEYDLSPWLTEGVNVLAVQVWNFGEYRPYAQFSNATGLIVQGATKEAEILNSDARWKVLENKAYSPELLSAPRLRSFTVVGPGDKVEGKEYPWDWEETTYDDSGWETPVVGRVGYPYGTGTDAHKMLVPRQIPSMGRSVVRFTKVRRSTTEVPIGFLQGKADFPDRSEPESNCAD